MANDTSQLSEYALHQRIREANTELPAEVEVPPGDDLAMIRTKGKRLLAGVDQVVVGRHLFEHTSPESIGQKAVLRSLSDAAAMASRPIATLAAATVPPGVSKAWGEELFDGLRTTAAKYEAPLVGGDLAMHAQPESPAVISVTVLAEPALPDDRVILRTGAKAGDFLAVTGELGGSLGADGGGRHLDFPPRLSEAVSLGLVLGENLVAMIDVSDGVARDSMRLLEAASQPLRCELDAGSIPARSGLDWRRAVGDGEDYELLFCCRCRPPAEIEGLPITVIGRFQESTQGSPRVVAIDGGEVIDLAGLGWEHAPK